MTLATDDSHISFAKRLAHNDATTREQTLKKLKRWLVTKSKQGTLTHVDIINIWKGLYYSMWYSDKPITQETLALDISQITTLFSDLDDAISFFRGFCETIAREWAGIDRLRLDKFYMFIKTQLKCTLEFCQSHQWAETIVSNVMSVLEDTFISLDSSCPDSISVFISEQFYPIFSELHTASTPGYVLTKFLIPYVTVISKTHKKQLTTVIVTNLFEPIEDTEFKFNIDKKSLGTHIYKRAKELDILTRNRKLLFKLRNSCGLVSDNGNETVEPFSLGKRSLESEGADAIKPKKKKKKKKKNKEEPAVIKDENVSDSCPDSKEMKIEDAEESESDVKTPTDDETNRPLNSKVTSTENKIEEHSEETKVGKTGVPKADVKSDSGIILTDNETDFLPKPDGIVAEVACSEGMQVKSTREIKTAVPELQSDSAVGESPFSEIATAVKIEDGSCQNDVAVPEAEPVTSETKSDPASGDAQDDLASVPCTQEKQLEKNVDTKNTDGMDADVEAAIEESDLSNEKPETALDIEKPKAASSEIQISEESKAEDTDQQIKSQSSTKKARRSKHSTKEVSKEPKMELAEMKTSDKINAENDAAQPITPQLSAKKSRRSKHPVNETPVSCTIAASDEPKLELPETNSLEETAEPITPLLSTKKTRRGKRSIKAKATPEAYKGEKENTTLVENSPVPAAKENTPAPKKSAKKKKRKSTLKIEAESTPSSQVKKRVRLSMENNEIRFFKKNTSLQSPTPFDYDKTPTKGVLKMSPALTRSQARKKGSSRVKR